MGMKIDCRCSAIPWDSLPFAHNHSLWVAIKLCLIYTWAGAILVIKPNVDSTTSHAMPTKKLLWSKSERWRKNIFCLTPPGQSN